MTATVPGQKTRFPECAALSDIAVESGRDFGSPFQDAVASKLRSLVYQIDGEVRFVRWGADEAGRGRCKKSSRLSWRTPRARH